MSPGLVSMTGMLVSQISKYAQFLAHKKSEIGDYGADFRLLTIRNNNVMLSISIIITNNKMTTI